MGGVISFVVRDGMIQSKDLLGASDDAHLASLASLIVNDYLGQLNYLPVPRAPSLGRLFGIIVVFYLMGRHRLEPY